MQNTNVGVGKRIVLTLLACMMVFFSVPIDAFTTVYAEDVLAEGEKLDEEGDDDDDHELVGESFTILLNHTNLSNTYADGSKAEENTLVAQTGDTVHFDFQSAFSAANATKPVTAYLYIKPSPDCADFLDFKYFRDYDEDSKVLEFDVSGGGSGTGENIRLFLTGPDSEGKYTIKYQLKQGQFIAGSIAYSYKEGYTPDGSSTEIWAEVDEEDQQEGDRISISVCDGHLTVKNEASSAWENLTKSLVTSNTLNFSKSGNEYGLSSGLGYTITVNPVKNYSGVIFSKDITITDTMTLGSALVFAEGAENKIKEKFTSENEGPLDVAIDSTRTRLTLTYTVENPYYDAKKDVYTNQMD